MDEIKLEIRDYYVLLNLHKALLEAKFHLNPDNTLVCLSPIIADLSNELVDILAKMDELKDERNVGKWDSWRKIETQQFYKERAIKNAVINNRWLDMKEEDKVRCAKNLLSPFVATEDELRNFIKQVDEAFISSELHGDNNV